MLLKLWIKVVAFFLGHPVYDKQVLYRNCMRGVHGLWILLQDTLKEIMDGTRPQDRGTLQQLHTYFRHKITSDVMKNFNHASDFLLVITMKSSSWASKLQYWKHQYTHTHTRTHTHTGIWCKSWTLKNNRRTRTRMSDIVRGIVDFAHLTWGTTICVWNLIVFSTFSYECM